MDGYLRLLGVLGGEISMKGDEHGIKVGDDVRLDGVGRRSNQTDAQLTHPTRDTNKLIKSVLAISKLHYKKQKCCGSGSAGIRI